MTPAIEVEASLPEPRPLDRVDAAAAAARRTSGNGAAGVNGGGGIIAVTATTAATAAASAAADDNNNNANALKLADCIGKVSAALAELGATVEALKGESFGYFEETRYFFVSLGKRRGDAAFFLFRLPKERETAYAS